MSFSWLIRRTGPGLTAQRGVSRAFILIVCAVLGVGGLVMAPYFLVDDPQRDRVTKTPKVYMHTLQTMVETYAVDWGGLYPPNLAALEAEARRPDRGYWKELITTPPRRFFQPRPSPLAMVLPPAAAPQPNTMVYQPRFNRAGMACSYEIYGYDFNLRPFTRDGQIERLVSEFSCKQEP